VDSLLSVADWIEAHPTFFGFLVPILAWLSTGIITAFKKPKTPEEYERVSQKAAAFWKGFGSIFFDAPKLRQAVKEFKHGYVPRSERPTPTEKFPAVKMGDPDQ
jgi:hypothetical protein